MSFNITMNKNGNGSMTVLENGEVFTINSEDPNFVSYVTGVRDGKTITEIKEELNAFTIVALTPLLTLHENAAGEVQIFFENERIDPILEATIIRYRQQNRPYHNLIAFLERLSDNKDKTSREFLYQWASTSGLKITEDGYLLGWRGLNQNNESVHSGAAYVDGVLHTGHIPNPVGSVVHMNREDCEANPDVSCGKGLHVGSERYAQEWGHGNVVYVKVDPKDVVSVPNHDTEKMRVSRFTVIDHVTQVDRDMEPEGNEEDITEKVTEFVDTHIEDKTNIKNWVAVIKDTVNKHR